VRRPPIIITCRLLDGTRSHTGSAYLAVTTVDGLLYAARSRHGAPHALARVLVDAGIPDAPVEVYYRGLAGCVRYRSLHSLANYTIAESATVPVSLRPYVKMAPRTCVTSQEPVSGGEAGMQGTDLNGSMEGRAEMTSPTAPSKLSHTCQQCGHGFAAKRADARFCSTRCQVVAHRCARLALVRGAQNGKPRRLG
jgi:hypothetical protein